jgi:phosphoglycolate phosphatase-like HAD superfamily hydrolase
LNAHNIAKPDALYIGDRQEDGEAAHANSMNFVWVAWGYGDPDRHPQPIFSYTIARKPTDIANQAI